jgi:hypothetical protein
MIEPTFPIWYLISPRLGRGCCPGASGLEGHNFYMFFNADSGQYNVIYLRDEGDYGLIHLFNYI